MKIKKLLALLLAAMMVFSLAACGSEGSAAEAPASAPASAEAPAAEEPAAPAEEAPAEANGKAEGMTKILEVAAQFTGYDWQH